MLPGLQSETPTAIALDTEREGDQTESDHSCWISWRGGAPLPQQQHCWQALYGRLLQPNQAAPHCQSDSSRKISSCICRWFSLLQVSLSYGVRLVLGPWLQHGAESPKVCCSIWQGKHLILHQKQHSLTSQLSKAKYFPFLQDCCRCSSCISRPASLMLLTCHSQAKLVGWLSTRCHL